jgi:hypothetical protein
MHPREERLVAFCMRSATQQRHGADTTTQTPPMQRLARTDEHSLENIARHRVDVSLRLPFSTARSYTKLSLGLKGRTPNPNPPPSPPTPQTVS